MADSLIAYFPVWALPWLGAIYVGAQVLLILIVAWAFQRSLRHIVKRASVRYDLPMHLIKPSFALVRWTIVTTAALLILGRLGVSGTVLWTAFTGFAAVGAVAFFAAWSVLSNIFCAFLIFTARPLRLRDYVEVLDSADKPGAKGEVVDITLLYVTLKDHASEPPGALLQIPNALLFQKVVRRWKGGIGIPPRVANVAPVGSDRSAA